MSKFIAAIDESAAIEMELSMVEESLMDIDIATEGMLSKAGELLKTAGKKLMEFIDFLIGLIPKAIEKIKAKGLPKMVSIQELPLDLWKNEHWKVNDTITKFLKDGGVAIRNHDDEKLKEIRDQMREYKTEISHKITEKRGVMHVPATDIEKYLKSIKDLLELCKEQAKKWENAWKQIHELVPGTPQEKNADIHVNYGATVELLLRTFCSALKVCILLMEKAEPVK